MSWQGTPEPDFHDKDKESVSCIILPRTHDIGGFEVRRALPSKYRRMVGPFIFWDQMGPGEFITNQGVDVRPHPHIGLSTLTYLFEGSLDHRDSLGIHQRIKPGEVNLMTAGKGIVHSERTGKEIRQKPHSLYGIQSWLALPLQYEETAPDFTHIEADALPIIEDKGIHARLLAGSYAGSQSPLAFPQELFYLDVHAKAGSAIPLPADIEELAVYPLKGQIEIGDTQYDPMQLLIVKPKAGLKILAKQDAHFIVFGGATMDSPRHIWWNFVSSSKERIEQAKQDWENGKFDEVPNDEEFIPLPDSI